MKRHKDKKVLEPVNVEWQSFEIKCPKCHSDNWVILRFEYENGWIYADCNCESCKLRFRMSAIVVVVME